MPDLAKIKVQVVCGRCKGQCNSRDQARSDGCGAMNNWWRPHATRSRCVRREHLVANLVEAEHVFDPLAALLDFRSIRDGHSQSLRSPQCQTVAASVAWSLTRGACLQASAAMACNSPGAL